MNRFSGVLVCFAAGLFATGSPEDGAVRASHVLRVEKLDLPSGFDSMVPQAVPLADGRIAVTWQEALKKGGYSFRFSAFDGKAWSKPVIIAADANLSMFTADLPGVTELADHRLMAYWELRDIRSPSHTDTAIQVSLSSDGGRTWTKSVTPYGNGTPGMHSFLTVFPQADGAGMVWLDEASRHSSGEMGEHGMKKVGAVGLRYVTTDSAGKQKSDSFLDSIVCECCPTSSALTKHGPVVVYRGQERPADTRAERFELGRPAVRDIHITRLDNGKWTEPKIVFPDRFVIDGCPDNGPTVDADGDNLAVAWWTRPEGQRKVEVAFSSDAGDSFRPAIRVDQGDGEGQATVVLAKGGAVVGWLEAGQVWARWVSRDGTLGEPVSLGAGPGHSRIAHWIARGNEVLATFTVTEAGKKRVRSARLRIDQ